MSLTLRIDNVDYVLPSSAADTNWAAQMVAILQALAAGVNGATLPDASTSVRGAVNLDEQQFGGLKIGFWGAVGQYFGPGYRDIGVPVAGTTIDVGGTTSTQPGSTFEPSGMGGDVLMTATPNITASIASGLVQDGQEILIINRDPTNKLTLQDQGTLPGSGLRLTSNTFDLVDGSSLRLRFFTNDGLWYEVGRSVPV